MDFSIGGIPGWSVSGGSSFGAGGDWLDPSLWGMPSSGQPSSGTGGGPSNPGGSWLSQLLPWANLGAQTFLADQAITSPRPSTITYLPNGQLAVTGGGAAPVAGAIGSIPSWIWIVLVLLVVVMLFKR